MLIGLTVHAGPSAWTEPTVPYNCLRTHDWAGKHAWYDIEVSPGVYDWSGLDWLAEKCAREGRQFVWVIYGTPTFYATDSVADPYGRIGGASFPNTAGLAAFRAFARAGMRRYGAGVMPVVEPWNEPVPSFFNGTRAQIAQLARIVYEEKRGHIVPTPSFFNITHLTDYLAEPDALYCDAINLHLYGNDRTQLEAAQAAYRTVCTAAGLPADLPFFHSEIGWQPGSQTGPGWNWDDWTDTRRAEEWDTIVRWLETTNCIGAIWYDYDGSDVGVYSMASHTELKAAQTGLVDLTGTAAATYAPLWSPQSNGPERLRDLPELAKDGSNLDAWAAAVTEQLQTFRGYRGDPLDRALTERRARAIGILNNLGQATGGSGGVIVIGGPGGGGGGTYTPDLTPPPTPTGLLVSAGFTNLIVECDPQTYTVGHGHDRTNVYGAKWAFDDPTAPTFSEAVRLWSFLGTVDAYTTEPSTRWCIWIKWQSKDGVESVAPAGGTNGFQVTTGLDVALVLKALTGKITSSELYASLGNAIGSIQQRYDELSADALASALAIHAEAAARAGALLDEARDRGTAITEVRRVLAEGDTRLAQQITTLTAAINSGGTEALAAIEEERIARVAADDAEAAARLTLAAQVGTNTAAIATEATTRATADTALASSITSLTATVGTNTAAISTEATTRANADTALSNSITTLTATVNGNTAAITSEATTRATADAALASSISTLGTTVAGNTAAIASEATTRASADSALATDITTLGVSVAGNTAAISTEATTRATQTGALFAQWTVKIDVNGYVSGFGLASTANNATPESAFIVRADSFSVASPSGPGIDPVVPFIVQTTPTTINGVAVPVGVYMDAAYILRGSITAAQIGNAVIDDAKIANLSAAKITAGSLDVGAHIRSTVYIPGSAGWTINADGTAEFSSVTIRGTVQAGNAAISGTTMTGAGARINPTGSFVMGNAAGNIAFNGTDPIRLNGAVVNTDNIALGGVSAQHSAFNGVPALSPAAIVGDSFITALSKTFTASGGTIVVLPQLIGNAVFTTTNSNDATIEAILYLDGVAVASGGEKVINPVGVTSLGENLLVPQAFTIPNYIANPAAGSHTLELKLRYRKIGGGDDIRAAYQSATLIILDFKR